MVGVKKSQTRFGSRNYENKKEVHTFDKLLEEA